MTNWLSDLWGWIDARLPVQRAWDTHMDKAFAEATLTRPAAGWGPNGKTGLHTEHRGYILAQMQHLQRTYPGASW